MGDVITRVLSHIGLITLLKHPSLYLERQGIISIHPTSSEIIASLSTLVSGQISAFRQPRGLCPEVGTGPNNWIDSQPWLVLYKLSALVRFYGPGTWADT